MEYPYVSICGQHDYRKQICRILLARNPGSNLFTDGQVQNTIVKYIFWIELTVITVYTNKSRHLALEVITHRIVVSSKWVVDFYNVETINVELYD